MSHGGLSVRDFGKLLFCKENCLQILFREGWQERDLGLNMWLDYQRDLITLWVWFVVGIARVWEELVGLRKRHDHLTGWFSMELLEDGRSF